MNRPDDGEHPPASPTSTLIAALTGNDPEGWPLAEDAGTRTRAALITDVLGTAEDAADRVAELPGPEQVMAAGWAAFLGRQGTLQDITQSESPSPEQRAERARASWEIYRITWGNDGSGVPGRGARIRDLIVDLLHLAGEESEIRPDVEDGDAQALLHEAHGAYESECTVHLLGLRHGSHVGRCGSKKGRFTVKPVEITCNDCLYMYRNGAPVAPPETGGTRAGEQP